MQFINNKINISEIRYYSSRKESVLREASLEL